ncbi:MAG TPA: FGGY-family carbohydrate kinase, partial [Terriglobales bacterium]|nr:FGGY-family carbohydrate kinase [Terriglobales bacterium]
MSDNPTLVAIDLGAESCRVSLLRWDHGQPNIEVVHRFPNSATDRGEGLRWDIQNICAGVEHGLRACAALVPNGIAAVGVDGWAVDYVRLNDQGQPREDPYCYRDERTAGAEREVNALISVERLYELTGIQHLRINTLYQLYADGFEGMDQRVAWTNLPEFILSFLGGRRVAEYTNATHTELVALNGRNWCDEIFEASRLQRSAAPPIVPAGTDLGNLSGSLSSLPAFRKTRLIAPACHDTASAIAGIPAEGDDWAFISSGTWSLIGVVLDVPCVSELARRLNFSNEGGIGGKTYFLKNVNGMWLLRQCIEQWGKEGESWTVPQLIEACTSLVKPETLIDVDDPELLLPGDMPARIRDRLGRVGPARSDAAKAPAMANVIFHSLASRYADVVRDLSKITGKRLKKIYIVGGGSKNSFLNGL